MGSKERQQRVREATRRAILDAALELFVADGYAQVSIRNIANRVEYSPGAIYGYFPSKDDIFFALAEEGFRLLGAKNVASIPSDDPLDDVRASVWRLYEFSKEHPQYFALVFLDSRVPRISREYEQFAFMSEMKARFHVRVRRCTDEGCFPATLHPSVAMRLLFAPVLGIAAMQLSKRLMPGEDADALARDAIDTTIAGLRAGAATHARPAAGSCPLDDRPAERDASPRADSDLLQSS
jgi:AcrR family transcriptional regulator